MAMGGMGGADPDQPLSEINVTPLVDVMLVLLVIFIVAAPLMAQALRVDLPRAAAPASTEAEVIELTLFRDGAIELDGRPLGREALPEHLRSLAEARPQAVLRLGADGAVAYQEVAEVLALARQGGTTRIAFATRTPVPPVPD